jgi:hypothetical protein
MEKRKITLHEAVAEINRRLKEHWNTNDEMVVVPCANHEGDEYLDGHKYIGPEEGRLAYADICSQLVTSYDIVS